MATGSSPVNEGDAQVEYRAGEGAVTSGTVTAAAPGIPSIPDLVTHAPGHGFDTRRRLFAAFLVLAAVFAAAFWSQLAGLRRIEDRLGQLQEHDQQARITVELENAIESQLEHQALFMAGDEGQLAGYRDARARAVRLLAELDRRVDEPEPDAWLAQIRETTAELDRHLQEEMAAAVSDRKPGEAAARDAKSALMHRVETYVYRVFGFLRGETMKYHEEVKELERSTLRLGILFFVGTPIIALAIAVYLSRSIARPLAVLGDGAARVASGDLASRIDLSTRDEFGALATKFNAMTSALREQQEKLVQSEKLATLGRLAAGVAHELNNPLQVILGYVSLDRHTVRGEIGTHLAAVEREAIRCQEIVEGLLQLSRPATPIVVEPVDLREVADEAAGALRVALGEPQPAIVVEGEGTALGTHGRLRQVVYNLAKNAAEAAGRTGRVRVEVSSLASVVQVAVSDTGAGIPPELRDRIFEPFFTTKSTGTGLGLPMARAIAHALGGDIEVTPGEACGARFTLRVPRAAKGGA
jgi:two-component system, NtrC family, sensor kinase